MGKEVFSKNIRVSDKPVKDWIPYELGYGINMVSCAISYLEN